MKTWWLVFLLVGLVLIWGTYGDQQAKKREYECQVRFQSFCFLWEKSDFGQSADRVKDAVERDTER